MSASRVAGLSPDASPEPAFELIDGRPDAGLVLLCDHASNRLPATYGDLGMSPAELRRHIAYDIGAADLTRELAGRLGLPAVLSRFSRLLIDPNRGEDDPTLIMRLSDGAVVPGNARIDAAERARRIQSFYAPYHQAIAAMLDRCLATGRPPAILSMHSFTPAWKGVRRPWHAGVLWDADPRLPHALIAALSSDPALTVGDNEPYSGVLKSDTLYRHGSLRGLAHAVLEVRQDLIGDAAGVNSWADRLEPILRRLMADPALGVVRVYSSNADRGAASQKWSPSLP